MWVHVCMCTVELVFVVIFVLWSSAVFILFRPLKDLFAGSHETINICIEIL